MLSKAQFLKHLSLLVLTIQTTTLVMVLRYSRISSGDNSGHYVSSTAILLSEIIKLMVCLLILLYQTNGSLTSLTQLLRKEVMAKPGETAKLLIPALLYTIQNNLLFLALTNLDAATYQVTYQLKILTTALFSVLMLHKRLALNQWLSLVLLMIGVTLVQWPQSETQSQPKDISSDELETAISVVIDEPLGNRLIGLLAVLASCFSSGFSGVYFEKLVKYTSQSLWIRNTQLALFSVITATIAMCVQDFDLIYINGFFQGYTTLTWIVVLLQAFGGLVVALVMKYADNILKGFATSISIVLSTVCSYYLMTDFYPTTSFLSGASIVIAANILYAF
ncbi:UDP-N-acetylglucosamine transporter-like [Oppia nitens]|uniref:UDP-N-acetylglucosamine transporter-like n=1 Tax=Oppia nitens TaxID=1686743 RepID=UPI0023D9DCB6|nr:UDP-N-acetylglucosamine transporter-like [Oppia nitens]